MQTETQMRLNDQQIRRGTIFCARNVLFIKYLRHDLIGGKNMEIKIRLEKDEDGIWVATCPSLPGCVSQGTIQ